MLFQRGNRPSRWLIAALLAAGCAKTADGAPPVPTFATNPAPGMAALYVFNKSQPVVFPPKKDIYDGNQKIVSVSWNRYTVVQIAPGRHYLSCADLPTGGEPVLDAVAGQTYYLVASMGADVEIQTCALRTEAQMQWSLTHMKPDMPQ